MRKKFLAILLAVCMIVSMIPATAGAATFDDTEGHWSSESVSRWTEAGVLNGDGTGKFLPDKEMTRAEFAQMLCNLMGYTEKADNTFTDVSDSDWYADAILKLVAAGVMAGVGDNKAAPNAPITREQAAVLLCRALNIKPTANASVDFNDAASVSAWAKDAVAALTERGMINGVGDNTFAPALNINRASVATMVDNMVAEYITEDTTITGEVNGVVIVKSGNVTVEDATLSDPVVVAPAATTSTVNLAGETKAADVVVAAEGAKVVVAETATAASVTVEAPKAEAHVAGKVETVAVAETAEGAKATVAATAEVKDVTVAAPNAETQVAGKAENVTVAETAEGAKALVAEGAEVTGVTVAAPKAEAQVAGKVETVAVAESAEGAKATVGETAEVTGVTVAAPNAETHVAGKVESVAVAETAEGAKAVVATTAEVKDVAVAAPNAETSISGTVANVAVAETATGASVAATEGAKVESVTTSAENVTVNAAKDTVTNVTASAGSADIKASGAEVKNDGADKVTVDGDKEVASGDKTTSEVVGETPAPIEPDKIDTSIGATTPDTPSTTPDTPSPSPKPSTPSGGGSSGGGGGGGGSSDPEPTTSPEPSPSPEPTDTPTTPPSPSVTPAPVVAAPLEDHDANKIPSESLGKNLKAEGTLKAGTTNEYDVTVSGQNIMMHDNALNVAGHWVGFGMPAAPTGSTYAYYVGDAQTPTASIADRTYTVGNKTYNTVYFSEDTEEAFDNATYKITVKDTAKANAVVAIYNVRFNVTFWKATQASLSSTMTDASNQSVSGNTIGSQNVGGTANISGLNATIGGEIDTAGLVTANGKGYTYFELAVKDELIKYLKNSGEGYDDPGYDIKAAPTALAIAIYDTAKNALLKQSHVFQLKDAAGRVQDTITVTVDATGATIKGAGAKVTFMDGDKLVAAVFADGTSKKVSAPSEPTKDGYTFKGWGTNQSDAEVINLSEATFEKATTLYAKWEAKSYAITITSPTNGTVTTNPASNAKYNEEVTITATPNEHFEVGTITVKDAKEQAVTVTSNKFTMPDGNVTVTVTFKSLAHKATPSVAALTDIIDAPFTNGKPSTAFQTIEIEEIDSADYTGYDHVYKVTGSINYVTGWTGYGSSEKDGYFTAIKFTNIPENFKFFVGQDPTGEGERDANGANVALTNLHVGNSPTGLSKNVSGKYVFRDTDGQMALPVTIGTTNGTSANSDAVKFLFLYGEVEAKDVAEPDSGDKTETNTPDTGDAGNAGNTETPKET